MIPFEIVPLSDERFLIVGQAKNATAPSHNPFSGAAMAKANGFYCLVQASADRE